MIDLESPYLLKSMSTNLLTIHGEGVILREGRKLLQTQARVLSVPSKFDTSFILGAILLIGGITIANTYFAPSLSEVKTERR